MSKIRALEDRSSSIDSEDEGNRKLSKEAQEESTKLHYNKALKTLAAGKKHKAADLLERLLQDARLTPHDEWKQFSPFQQQMHLGCLKLLGDLYREGECKDLERAKLIYERAIYCDQDDNINLWYRLGKICLELGDLYTAHTAFGYALHLRPCHWGCLENMVTVCYATQDYIGCLNYCATGLSNDSGFVKGLVFRDLVYNLIPEFKLSAKENVKDWEGLDVDTNCEESWKTLYVNELREVESRARDRIVSVQNQIDTSELTLQISLESPSFVELSKEVLAAYENSRGTENFHKIANIVWTIQDANSEPDEETKPLTTEESQMEVEDDTCPLRRSLSSSEDKENSVAPPDTSSQADEEKREEKKADEAGLSENSTPLDMPTQSSQEEANAKKKNRKDVKWWQMEGKRRSQRVRGHLIPVSPEKAKKESSFADQLKNLIPASLLGDDGLSIERQSAKVMEKSGWQKKMNLNYFGSKEEEAHVKQLLINLTGRTLPSMVIETVQFLSNTVKYPWPSQLQSYFVSLYKYYRSHFLFPNVPSNDASLVFSDAFVTLAFLEIIVEKYAAGLPPGDKHLTQLIEKEVYFLEDCATFEPTAPRDFLLRLKWLSSRRLVQTAVSSIEDNANSSACAVLTEMEADLRNEPITVWTVNETANFICLESVTEKATGIAKVRNSQVVTDLFQSLQYESLIDVLEDCINFSAVEKQDLSDIYYYTVSLFRINKTDSIHHCINMINHAIRLQENCILSDALILLDEIWDTLENNFTLQEKRSTVSALIKILVACERKAPSQESVVTLPWCILHSVMFSLEKEEPAFYLEEETVPNSILLLQMAHECVSRFGKCCMHNGKLMLYTMRAVLAVKKQEEYFAFEETRYCMEQAIFCLYSHPSKKSKVKNLKDHNSEGIPLTWDCCSLLYQFYCPDEIPEFDSYGSGSIGSEVEALFQRILNMMPPGMSPTEEYKAIEEAIHNCEYVTTTESHVEHYFPVAFRDIYYLIGDHYFKNKDSVRAVTYYTYDLAVNSARFDSLAAISLSLGEHINTTINTADEISFTSLLRQAKSTAHCFHCALNLMPSNMTIRIEFGSFVYAMHAYCSRLIKHQTDSMDMEVFTVIQDAKDDFLKSSLKCFEPIAKKSDSMDDGMEEEQWIHHYMLGKISEKMREDADEFLKQYEMAGKLLHDQGAPYPAKMNYYSPPELALEALEVYYRIHASILNLVETSDYSEETEKLCLQFIRRQAESPFAKCKQSKGDGGEGKKGRKATDDVGSRKNKKDLAEIAALLKELVDETEKLVESAPPVKSAQTSGTSSSSSSSSSDDSSTDSVETSAASTSCPSNVGFSLSAFCKRLEEKEQKLAAIISEKEKTPETSPSQKLPEKKAENQSLTEIEKCAKEAVSQAQPESPPQPEDLYAGLDMDNNHFYKDFKDKKFGGVISLCLKAMEECISRYASHFKSYCRIAQTYKVVLQDSERAKEYLLGSPNLTQRKIAGLFGERKANNFFNGIWRHPIDDIDRPGSFSFHMNKAMHLLLDVLTQLAEHQLLADIVMHLGKVPDNEKKYLSNPDREMFCQQALNCCVQAVRKKVQKCKENYHELGLEVFETHVKLQKHNSRELPLSAYMHDIYKKYFKSQLQPQQIQQFSDDGITVEHALRYFSLQFASQKATTNRTGPKWQNSAQDQSKNQDGPTHRKRGRRNIRQGSQESPTRPLPQGLEIFDSAAVALQVQNLLAAAASPTTVPFSLHSVVPQRSLYPMMDIPPLHSVINPLLSFKPNEYASPTVKTPTKAHDSSLQITLKPSSRTGTPDGSNTSGDLQPKSLMTRKDASSSSSSAPRNIAPVKSQKSATPPVAPKYPPNTPVQQIRLNTSPYKAQQTAVEKPPEFSYKKRSGDTSPQVVSSLGGTPPVAHSQTTPPKRSQPRNATDTNVEVIDLTKRSSDRPLIVARIPAGKGSPVQANINKKPVGYQEKKVSGSPNPVPSMYKNLMSTPSNKSKSVISIPLETGGGRPVSKSPLILPVPIMSMGAGAADLLTPVKPNAKIRKEQQMFPRKNAGLVKAPRPKPKEVSVPTSTLPPPPTLTPIRSDLGVTRLPGSSQREPPPMSSELKIMKPKPTVTSFTHINLPKSGPGAGESRPRLLPLDVGYPRSERPQLKPSFPFRKRPVDEATVLQETPRATTSIFSQPPRRLPEDTRPTVAYPLPPKKKHQMMYQENVAQRTASDIRPNRPDQHPTIPPASNSDAVEVIFIDD